MSGVQFTNDAEEQWGVLEVCRGELIFFSMRRSLTGESKDEGTACQVSALTQKQNTH